MVGYAYNLGAGVWGHALQENLEFLHLLRSILVHSKHIGSQIL